MTEFHGLVNNERVFIAKTFSQLKRLASRYCNNSYNSVDEMRVTVYDVDNCPNTDILHFYRLNKVYTNNTIKRGEWK